MAHTLEAVLAAIGNGELDPRSSETSNLLGEFMDQDRADAIATVYGSAEELIEGYDRTMFDLARALVSLGVPPAADTRLGIALRLATDPDAELTVT